MNKSVMMAVILAVLLSGFMLQLVPDTDGSDFEMKLSSVADKHNNLVLVDAETIQTSDREASIRNVFDSLDGRVVLINGEWSDTSEIGLLCDNLNNAVRNGNVVLMSSKSMKSLPESSLEYSTAFAESADLCGISYDASTDATYCYSSIGYNGSDSIDLAYRWINEMEPTSASDGISKEPVLYSLTRIQASFGEMTIETKYTKYAITDSKCLMLTEYSLTGKPYPEDSIWDNWIAIADLKISSTHVGSQILDYGPDTSSDTRTRHSVSLSASDSNVSVNEYWSYTLKESKTHVTKNGNSLTIWHDTDEKGSDKLNAKTMKPGTVCLANKNGNIFSYQEEEVYTVNYYKDSTIVSDKFVEDNCTMKVTIL